jgi:hypothetical protein
MVCQINMQIILVISSGLALHRREGDVTNAAGIVEKPLHPGYQVQVLFAGE